MTVFVGSHLSYLAQNCSWVCLRELPVEWESRAEKEELEISVEDLTEENYLPKKKAFHPFSGRGYRLGRQETLKRLSWLKPLLLLFKCQVSGLILPLTTRCPPISRY